MPGGIGGGGILAPTGGGTGRDVGGGTGGGGAVDVDTKPELARP